LLSTTQLSTTQKMHVAVGASLTSVPSWSAGASRDCASLSSLVPSTPSASSSKLNKSVP
jgi:hypothetical protein